LVVEANDQTLRGRGDELLLDGHEVVTAGAEQEARVKLSDGSAHAVVLGSLDSPVQGLGLLRSLRAGEIAHADPRLPVISVGADSDHSAARIYRAGADVVLPLSASPLLVSSAVTAVLTRLDGQQRRILQVGSLRIDSDAREATINGRAVPLTRLEFDLLESLAQTPHSVKTRPQLAKEVWNTEFVAGRTIDSHAGRLRQKLTAAGADPLVQTIRGVGYRLNR
jgi:DNA-binding response OmpR family regulator